MNFGFYARNGYYATPEARLEAERMAESGIPWVCLISTLMQEQYSSTRIFRDFENTPADDELMGMIHLLHEKGIKGRAVFRKNRAGTAFSVPRKGESF